MMQHWCLQINGVFNCHNCKGIKYLTRLRLGLSHLREHKFKQAFKILWIHFVPVALKLKLIWIFFFFTAPCLLIKDASSWAQLKILIVLWQIIFDSSLTDDLILTHILLFGKASSDTSANTLLLNATMNYIMTMKRFEESLF